MTNAGRSTPAPYGLDDIADLGAVLAVFAHPDDETYLAGGVMAALAGQGRHVVSVTATWGEAGIAGGDGRSAARRRRDELEHALAILGVRRLVGLGFPDGGCADVDAGRAVERLRRIVHDVLPDTIVTFGPDGFTGHPDHRAVSRWIDGLDAPSLGIRVLHAAATRRHAERFADLHDRFEVFAPGLPATVDPPRLAVHLELDEPLLGRKVAALRAHRSQTGNLIAAVGDARYRAWVAEESFR